MRIDLGEDEPVEVQMAPLIDCVFLLLIFFLVASTLKESMQTLPLQLPQAGASAAAEAAPDQPLVIRIDQAGTFDVDGRLIEKSELAAVLQARVADNPSRPVRVEADRQTAYQNVVDALDALRAAGSEKVGLQTINSEKR